MRARLAGLTGILILAGCVPMPNSRCMAPQISGSVVRKGAPVADAEVLLVSSFVRETAMAKTDAEGRFKLGPLTQFNLTRTVLGDPLYKYELKVKAAGEAELSAFYSSGMGDAPETLELDCDLGTPITKRKQVSYCAPAKP
ncbi:MAG: carboxypeptidase regulatory-like domain-containing protein [Elusimicrobia bacterium]|nr:carboxypeptidase regulatory-like domain-containing protein [Elusimicrobiota bacterium]